MPIISHDDCDYEEEVRQHNRTRQYERRLSRHWHPRDPDYPETEPPEDEDRQEQEYFDEELTAMPDGTEFLIDYALLDDGEIEIDRMVLVGKTHAESVDAAYLYKTEANSILWQKHNPDPDPSAGLRQVFEDMK